MKTTPSPALLAAAAFEVVVADGLALAAAFILAEAVADVDAEGPLEGHVGTLLAKKRGVDGAPVGKGVVEGADDIHRQVEALFEEAALGPELVVEVGVVGALQGGAGQGRKHKALHRKNLTEFVRRVQVDA